MLNVTSLSAKPSFVFICIITNWPFIFDRESIKCVIVVLSLSCLLSSTIERKRFVQRILFDEIISYIPTLIFNVHIDKHFISRFIDWNSFIESNAKRSKIGSNDGDHWTNW